MKEVKRGLKIITENIENVGEFDNNNLTFHI